MLKRIRFFIYDSKKLNSLLDSFYETVAFEGFEDLVIRKGWVNGYHIEILLSTFNDRLIEKLKSLFINQVELQAMSDRMKQKYSIILEKVKMLEEYKGDIYPFYNEGDCIEDFVDTNYLTDSFKSEGSVAWNLAQKRTLFIINSKKEWNHFSKEIKQENILKMALWIAYIYPDKIQKGGLSFRSNFEYFKQQLKEDSLNSTRLKWLEYVIERDEKDKRIINTILDDVEEWQSGRQTAYFKNYILYIESIKEILQVAAKENKLFINELYTADDFFERVQNPSEFHELFYKEKSIKSLYNKEKFIIHRYLLTYLYSLFPLLQISVLEKQKVLGMAAEAIENYSKMNWKSFYIQMKGDN
ncbi:hypothetical protein [Priestia megaterium]|uniref:hypothetical protein n=1 Tax=Priestia megaterium TaxID=1404 RepID=UPI003012A8A5